MGQATRGGGKARGSDWLCDGLVSDEQHCLWTNVTASPLAYGSRCVVPFSPVMGDNFFFFRKTAGSRGVVKCSWQVCS